MQNNQKSIHIVIFTGGLYPQPEKTVSYWKNPMHSQPDYVIAADSGLEACLDYKNYYSELYDFTPSKLVGDFDSLKDKSLLEGYAGLVEEFPCDKDFTDTELAVSRAFEYASEQQVVPFVTLIGGDGGRLDHLLNTLNGFRNGRHPDVWLCKEQQFFYMKKGNEYLLSDLNQDDNVSFLNLHGKGQKIETCGLEWESKLFRNGYMPSVSNRISEHSARKDWPVIVKPKAIGFMVIGPLSMCVTNLS